MTNKIHIPAPLRAYTEQQKTIVLEGATVAELLGKLVAAHPDLKPHLYDEGGLVRRFVNIYVNDEDIRYLEGEKTKLAAGDTVSLVPSVSGGRS